MTIRWNLLCSIVSALSRFFSFFGGSKKEEAFDTFFTMDQSCNLQSGDRCKSLTVTERLPDYSSSRELEYSVA